MVAGEKFDIINDKYIKQRIEYDEILEAHKKCFQTKRKAESSVDTRTHKKGAGKKKGGKKKGGKKKCCKKKCCKKKLSKKKCCKKKCCKNTKKNKRKQKGGTEPIYKYMKRYTYDYDKIKELLEAGANPNIKVPNQRGVTPIAISVYYEDSKLFDLLMEYGADPFKNDDVGGNAYDAVRFMERIVGNKDPEFYEKIKDNIPHYEKVILEYKEKIKEKMKPKEDAATYMQSRYRGKLTRKRNYLSRYSSYKPWKGTVAIDYYLYTDEDIFNYLRQDDNNFVLKLPSTKEEKYEAWNVNDILTSIKLPNTTEPLMFYECLTAEHTLRSDNVSTDSKFMKIGGSQFIVKFPDWLYSYFIYNTTAKANRVTSAPRLPEPRIYRLKKYKEIFGLVSNKIYDYHEIW